MSSAVHISLNVSDLSRSTDFYRRFFGEPKKLKSDYVKFVARDPEIHLALQPGHVGGQPDGALSHLGIRVDSTGEVRRWKSALAERGLPTEEEKLEACCYALQEKFWVTSRRQPLGGLHGPQGHRGHRTESGSRDCLLPAEVRYGGGLLLRRRSLMEKEPLRVLFLCTGNSARSQIGEALLRHMSRGRIDVESAGSRPRPEIHPMARQAMKDLFGLDMAGQRPKPLEEFLGERFDYIITVCDRAAESCPMFPDDPERIRWSFEDPAAVEGDDEKRQHAFEQMAHGMAGRIRIWMSLPAVASRVTAARDAHVV